MRAFSLSQKESRFLLLPPFSLCLLAIGSQCVIQPDKTTSILSCFLPEKLVFNRSFAFNFNFEVTQSNLANVAHGKKGLLTWGVCFICFPFRMKHVCDTRCIFFLPNAKVAVFPRTTIAAPNSTFLRNANGTHKTTTCWNG